MDQAAEPLVNLTLLYVDLAAQVDGLGDPRARVLEPRHAPGWACRPGLKWLTQRLQAPSIDAGGSPPPRAEDLLPVGTSEHVPVPHETTEG